MEGYILQWMGEGNYLDTIGQTTVEGMMEGDILQWTQERNCLDQDTIGQTTMEGYILRWMDTTHVKWSEVTTVQSCMSLV